MHSDRYTISFALLICVSCSVVLALAAGALKPMINRNVEFDVHKNILLATGLIENPKNHTLDEMEHLYQERISGIVIDANGEQIPDRDPGTIEPEKDPGLLPLYVRKDSGVITAYCLPVSGKGLWSTIYGYLALESDGKTIKGITFYQHGETPGLGGEIEQRWFTDHFKGKTIFNESGELISITVAKGKIPAGLADEKLRHTVDGISGATLTGNGINVFLKKDLERYKPYLLKIQNGSALH